VDGPGCSKIPSARNTPSNVRGEKGKTWSQRPPHLIIVLGLGLISALPQINSSQLGSFLSGSGVSLLSGRGGAEWKCVDVELGRSCVGEGDSGLLDWRGVGTWAECERGAWGGS